MPLLHQAARNQTGRLLGDLGQLGDHFGGHFMGSDEISMLSPGAKRVNSLLSVNSGPAGSVWGGYPLGQQKVRAIKDHSDIWAVCQYLGICRDLKMEWKSPYQTYSPGFRV
jgi:hypothetical protein